MAAVHAFQNYNMELSFQKFVSKLGGVRHVRQPLYARFSLLGGSLFSSELSVKPKRTQTATEVTAVWVRFGFQLGLRK